MASVVLLFPVTGHVIVAVAVYAWLSLVTPLIDWKLSQHWRVHLLTCSRWLITSKGVFIHLDLLWRRPIRGPLPWALCWQEART